MRVRHHPTVDSAMARYWREGDVFEVYDTQGQLVLTLTGGQLMHWIAAQAAQAKVVIDLARAQGELERDLYPRRRLLGQHKKLKGR